MATEARSAKLKKVVENRQSGLVVVMEDVHDPHNAAAVIRSCDAFGIQNFYQIFEKETNYNSKKIGKVSSSSANKWIDIHTFESTTACFQELKSQGYQIWVTALAQESRSLYETNFLEHDKIALVFGNESTGVSQNAIDMADHILEIPMQGIVESFNISVSAAICMYEVTRQRMSDRDKYSISVEEVQKLHQDFLLR